jgi:hypothetical protein
MATIFQYQIPEAFDQTLFLLIRQSMAALERHGEVELLAWARSIEARYSDEAFRERFGEDLDSAKRPLAESSSDEDPPTYALLIQEFSAFYTRSVRIETTAAPDVVDHSLDLGDVLLDSLEKLLQSHPISAAFVSLVRELVKLAKAISKRQ